MEFHAGSIQSPHDFLFGSKQKHREVQRLYEYIYKTLLSLVERERGEPMSQPAI